MRGYNRVGPELAIGARRGPGGRPVQALPALLLALSLATTAFLYRQQRQTLDARRHALFTQQIGRLESTLATRLLTYEDAVRGAQALLAANPATDRVAFQRYVATLDIPRHYPGVNGLGLISYVPRARLAAFEAATRASGAPSYSVWPAGSRATYFPIRYVEPLGPNRRALGYDVDTEALRRAAAERARDTGAAIRTSKIILVQDATRGPGFLLILPLYRGGTDPGTVAARRAALTGWVYAPVRMPALMQGLASARDAELDVAVYDGTHPAPAALLYDSATVSASAGALVQKTRLDLAGGAWTLRFATRPAFDAAVGAGRPLLILLTGVGFGVLLGALTLLLVTGRARALALATRMTASLRASEGRFRALSEHGSDLVCILGLPDGGVRYESPSYPRVLGARLADLHREAGSPLGVIHPEDRPRVRAAFAAITEGGAPAVTLDIRHRHADGAWRTLEAICTNRLDDPDIGGIVVTSRDITERARADMLRRVEMERLSGVIATQQEVALADLDTRVVLPLIAARARELAGADGAVVELVEGDELVYHATDGMLQGYEGTRLPLIGTLTGLCVGAGESLYCADAATDPRTDAATCRRLGIGSMVVVPLRHGGAVVGALKVSATAAHAFDTRALQTLQLMAGVLGAALGQSTAFAALRASEERLRTVVANAPLILFTLDPDGVYTMSDGAGLAALGRAPSAVVGRSVFDVYRDQPELLDYTRQALAGTPVIFPSRVNGAVFDTHLAPLRDERGSLISVIGVSTNITERARAEEALAAERGLRDAVLDHVQAGIVACDADGTLTLFNRATRALHGLPEEPLPPDRWAEHYALYGPDGRTPLRPEEIPLLRALRGEQVRDAEMVIAPKGASPRTLLASGQAIRDPAGRTLGAVVAMHDITARKRMEAELERSNAELQQFAYVASHDLQEPLRTVMSYLKLLQRRYGGKLGEDADEFIGFATDGAQRMSALIKAVLEYSRVGTRASSFAPADCQAIAAVAVAGLEARIAETGARVSYAGLPTVLGDGPQLGQLFQNLIGNALKFRRPDVAPEVTISAERQGDAWLCRVQDNGIGIAPEHAERIFVMFQRLHTRAEYEGTGIGLAVCKRIVERHHGGQLWVESEPGQGAAFLFTLPACDAAERSAA